KNRARSSRRLPAMALARVVDLHAVIAQRRLAADQAMAHVARDRLDIALAWIAEAAAAGIDEGQAVTRLDEEIGLLRRQLLLIGSALVVVQAAATAGAAAGKPARRAREAVGAAHRHPIIGEIMDRLLDAGAAAPLADPGRIRQQLEAFVLDRELPLIGL